MADKIDLGTSTTTGAAAGAGVGTIINPGLGTAIGAGIGGLLGAGGSILSSLIGANSNEDANRTNKEIAIWNVLQQQEANRNNLAFQREALEYQKALNETIMNREDTAYQRTVADMRAAGLNPLAMKGTNGSGGTAQAPEAMNTTAAQMNYNEKPYLANIQIGNLAREIFGTLNEAQNFEIGKDYQRQQKAIADQAEIDTLEKKYTLANKIWTSNNNRLKTEWETKDFLRNMIFNENFGIFNGMNETDRNLRFLRSARGKNENWDWGLENKGYNPNYTYMYDPEQITDYAKERALLFAGQSALDTIKDIANIKKEIGFDFKGLKKWTKKCYTNSKTV